MPFGTKWSWRRRDGKQQVPPSGPKVPPVLNYQTLGVNEIRLIQVLPGAGDTLVELKFLPNTSINHLPSYHALSYTWGDQTKIQAVVVNGIPVQITRNLAVFLQHHRQNLFEELDTMWIDALCINQTNNDEKTAQLLLMRQVYEKARSTIVWLGAETDVCQKGIQLMNTVPRSLPASLNKYGQGDLGSWLEIEANRALVEECWPSFVKLVSLPWFSRIWAKQEFIVSSKIEIQYGKHHLSITDFYPTLLYLPMTPGFGDILSKIIEEHPEERRRVDQYVTSSYQIYCLALVRKYRLDDQYGFPILNLLWSFRDNEATDPRDKVYALLGLLQASDADLSLHTLAQLGYDPEILVVDYGAKVEDVYKSLVKAVVEATGKLNVLSAAQSDGISVVPTMSCLPSWAPDWSRPWISWSLLKQDFQINKNNLSRRRFNAAKSSDAIAHFSDVLDILRVKGVVVDIINEVWGTFTAKVDGVNALTNTSAASYREKAQRWSENRSLDVYGTTTSSDQALWDSLTALGMEEDTFEKWSVDFSDWIQNSIISATILDRCLITMRGRQIMIGKKGYVITGPMQAVYEDIVCVLLGCCVPVVLRSHQSGKYFEFIGECYCAGVMKGEMMDAVDAGTAEIVEFELR